jgi:hypothetical protein
MPGPTALEIARRSAVRLKIQRPSTLFAPYNEGDISDVTLLESIMITAQYLASTYEWQTLRRRHQFTTVATEAQPDALPPDMMRPILEGLVSRSLLLHGPMNAQEWAQQTAGYAVGGMGWHIEVGVLKIAPAPPAGMPMQLSYLTNSICVSGASPVPDGDLCPVCAGHGPAGVFKPAITCDYDELLWDQELMILGTVMNYRKLDRMDYASDSQDFERMMQDRIKRDGGARVLRMGESVDRLAAGRRPPMFVMPV